MTTHQINMYIIKVFEHNNIPTYIYNYKSFTSMHDGMCSFGHGALDTFDAIKRDSL